jgi:hypothetical protein
MSNLSSTTISPNETINVSPEFYSLLELNPNEEEFSSLREHLISIRERAAEKALKKAKKEVKKIKTHFRLKDWPFPP